MYNIIFAFVISLLILRSFLDNVTGQRMANIIPDQIHIALGNNYSEMTIMWITADDPKETVVRYGESVITLFQVENGTRKELINGVIWPRRQMVHRVVLKGLKPNWRYYKEEETARVCQTQPVFWQGPKRGALRFITTKKGINVEVGVTGAEFIVLSLSQMVKTGAQD